MYEREQSGVCEYFAQRFYTLLTSPHACKPLVHNGNAGRFLSDGVHVRVNITTTCRRYNAACAAGLLPYAPVAIFINHFYMLNEGFVQA